MPPFGLFPDSNNDRQSSSLTNFLDVFGASFEKQRRRFELLESDDRLTIAFTTPILHPF